MEKEISTAEESEAERAAKIAREDMETQEEVKRLTRQAS